MTQNVHIFHESVGNTGIARVSSIHYQPEILTADQLAKGVAASLEAAPTLKPGFKAELYVNVNTGTTFYNTSVNTSFFMPYSDFMAMLPLSTRLALQNNRATDPVVESFLNILESSRDDSASKGVNPVTAAMSEYYDMFVTSGYITQDEVNTIIVQ